MKFRWTSSLVLLVAITLCTLVASIASGQQLGFAPPNPAYQRYLNDTAAGAWRLVTPDGHGLGYVPSPFIIRDPNLPAGMALPPRYGHTPAAAFSLAAADLPPIRDQGFCGSCWTFATYGSMETCALVANDDASDWSENNLKNNHGYDWTCCNGGNSNISAGYLTRWVGPITEAADPYTIACTGSSGTVQRHVQDMWWLPTNNPTAIKDELYHHGGVFTAYYSGGTYYNNGSSVAYYYNGTADLDHAVTIVGYDDNYSRLNFSPSSRPSGNGAWYVRNSWGTWGGYGGYFWVSYEDTWFAKVENALFHATEVTNNLAYRYEYDPLGQVGSWGYTSAGGYLWCANIFPRTTVGGYAQQQLEAVSFYTNTAGDSYTLEIRRNCSTTNPRSGGTVAHSSSGSFTYAGYHTVRLAAPVDILATDTRFSISLQLGPGAYQIPLEYISAGYSSGASGAAGQSFVHDTLVWQDAYTYFGTGAQTNCCIKAFVYGGPYPVRLSDLSAQGEHGRIRVRWETASEVGTVGYVVVRAERPEGPFEEISRRMIAAEGQPGQVGTYEFVDPTAQPGRVYYYRIREVSGSGTVNEIEETVKAVAGGAGLYNLLPSQIRALLAL